MAMRPTTDAKRLRRVLVLLFLALCVPTGVLIWQAYDQLKFEAFYQYQRQAEAFTARVDAELRDELTALEARGFADFAFLNLAADSGSLLQRSPLAEFPVRSALPGVLGYFQVDADGVFSTPLLPDPAVDASSLGIPATEMTARTEAAASIRRILTDNRLLREQRAGMPVLQDSERFDDADYVASGNSTAAIAPAGDSSAFGPDVAERVTDDNVVDANAPAAAQAQELDQLKDESGYSQEAFDLLKRLRSAPASSASADSVEAAPAASGEAKLGNLRDLQLDEAMNRKSEDANRAVARKESLQTNESRQAPQSPQSRMRRVETVALPEAEALSEEVVPAADGPARITTFESELDPFDFSLLGSGHGVLYRNVWRDGQRYIQGVLIDQEGFIRDSIAAKYRATLLSGMSNLLVAFQGDVVTVVQEPSRSYAPGGAGQLGGSLLHRARLSAPLDGVQLVFSVNRLPAGAGGRVLAWTTVAAAAVFIAGFMALYRLGLGQIRLAEKQRDFVSAVSHELKTPLTSIRMYGEMLREGWVEDDKRNQYYDYIHDESERLGRLIGNVLRLAKISRNDPDLDLKILSVGEVLSQVESKVTSQVERADFELEISGEPNIRDRHVSIDMDCFTQIIINLVDNALKFSANAKTRRIVIRSAADGDTGVAFSVRDFGPGIPRDQMKKIFTLFYRSESELTRETVGTGIGLAIVHQLTLSMGGKVDVVNREPGAEFVVRLPCKAVVPASGRPSRTGSR